MSTDSAASGWAKALAGDRKQFDMFFDRMLDGFAYHKIILDKSGKPIDYIFLEVNRAFEMLTGLKREKIIGKKVTEVLLGIEKDSANWIGVYGKVALTGEPVQFENCATQLDKWYRVAAYCPEKGYFVALFEDISERKKAEESLKRTNDELEARVQERTKQISSERQRLYNVLETLPAYVVLLDKDYRVPFANKVFRESFGESKGRRCHEYLFNLNLPCENCETFKVLKTNQFNHWEWTGPNGHNYDIYDYPFVEADGSTLIMEMGIDITERKKAEQQAFESARKLKDAERLAAIGVTAGMVGHDIRNPLQAIVGDIYFVKKTLNDLPESVQISSVIEDLGAIEKNIDYINKIVQDLQDYARPLNPNVEESDLKQIVESLFVKNCFPKNIEVNVELAKDASKIRVDAYYLNRILYNLVTNAVQAMPQGGKLTIGSYKEENDNVITISDTGVGIPEDIQDKMFTLMFTTKSKGQGFGLPVVKRLTESLGGKVTFESEEGKGTTFIIRLPLPKS